MKRKFFQIFCIAYWRWPLIRDDRLLEQIRYLLRLRRTAVLYILEKIVIYLGYLEKTEAYICSQLVLKETWIIYKYPKSTGVYFNNSADYLLFARGFSKIHVLSLTLFTVLVCKRLKLLLQVRVPCD